MSMGDVAQGSCPQTSGFCPKGQRRMGNACQHQHPDEENEHSEVHIEEAQGILRDFTRDFNGGNVLTQVTKDRLFQALIEEADERDGEHDSCVAQHAAERMRLEEYFGRADWDGDGKLNARELASFLQMFYQHEEEIEA